jgi:hypothetical protein
VPGVLHTLRSRRADAKLDATRTPLVPAGRRAFLFAEGYSVSFADIDHDNIDGHFRLFGIDIVEMR